MYRMPTAFGNSPGPRSDLEGRRFDWSGARRLVVSWQSAFDPDVAARMLPERVTLRSGNAVLDFQQLENLPWLAGRGYSLMSAKLPVHFKQADGQPRDMMFLLVMFENLADPIITGREELGFAKVFADLGWKHNAAGVTGGNASWFGTEFFRFELGAQSSSPATSQPVDMLHHRYIPAVGDWGKPWATQFACSPAAAVQPLASVTRAIDFRFTPEPWSALPTLSHIVQGLADLGFVRQGVANVSHYAGGADHAGQYLLS
jgi:hypothetical protein